MLRRHFLALLPAPLVRRFRLGLGQAPAVAVAVADPVVPLLDAAAIYERAFRWARGLSAADRDLLGDWRPIAGAGVDPRVVRLLDHASPALENLRAAARAATCSWGPAEGVVGDLTTGRHDIICGRAVVHAACLAALGHATAGRGRAALDDLFAVLGLAHRVGAGGVILAQAVSCAHEVSAFRTLGRILPSLDRATLDDLAGRLDRLPAVQPASATIGPEARYILGSIRAKSAALGPKIGDDQWPDLDLNGDEAATLGRITGGDRARLLDHLDANGPAFAELARRLDLPRPGCRAAVEAFGREVGATFPVAAGLVDAAWGVRHVVDRMIATRALAHAGLALVRDGEDAARAIADPYGVGGFTIERRGRGHRIRSALRDGGRPEVALEIGEPG